MSYEISINLGTPSGALLLNLTDWNLCSNGNRLLFEIDLESNIISLDSLSESLGMQVHHCFTFLRGRILSTFEESHEQMFSCLPTRDVIH